MDVPTRTHSWMLLLMFFFVCLVDPTHGIFDGLRTVDSCTKRNVSRVVVHPSIVPSVGRVVERVCAEARERTARWSVRAYARVDGSIDIFSMHRVSSSAFACVGRVGRVGRMRGWLDGWEKPRALWTGAAARLCERGSIPCFFFWRVVNRGFVRGSTHTQTTLRVLVLVLRVRVRANARDGWRDGWMKWGVNFVRLTIGFNFNACAT